ncbi:MAG: alpha/beta family hydrolase [Isosphaerales bacterium]
MKFLATPEKGEVSALLVRPGDASHLLVLGHGVSTNMRHATLQTIADRMAEAGIATFRYNFPFMEHGKGRDSQSEEDVFVEMARIVREWASRLK